jgi:hypothetical protein
MLYHSTRNSGGCVDSARAVLEGLAPDGGLYMPEYIPDFDWKKCLGGDSLAMATQILSALLPDIPDMENLVKNAYVHSPGGSKVEVHVSMNGFTISNQGESALDEKKIFRRFYQPSGRKEGSTGLGLALAYSVCARSGMNIGYSFAEGRHTFSVILKK